MKLVAQSTTVKDPNDPDGKKRIPGKDKVSAIFQDPDTGNIRKVELGASVKSLDVARVKLDGLRLAGAEGIPHAQELSIELQEAANYILEAYERAAEENKLNVADPRAVAKKTIKGKPIEVAL